MSDMLKIGLVNFVTNTPYASIHKFCPTEDFMYRLQHGQVKPLPYYSRRHARDESQEYNTLSYESLYYEDYFKKNYNLNIIGYVNQAANFYMVSKFLNTGLTFLVLNVGHIMNVGSLLIELGNYISILKKNSPNSSYAFVLRYPNTSKWSFIATSKKEAENAILEKYPECKSVIIQPFAYTADYDIIYDTFTSIRDAIENFYEDECNFTTLTPDEQKSLSILLDDKILSKKTACTENTIRAVCNSSHVNVDKFMKKIVDIGFFTNFNGDPIKKYYFRNGSSRDKIMPVLLNLLEESTYIKRDRGPRIGRHFVTNVRFRNIISDEFKEKIVMSDRLILKILKSLKVGRTTLRGNKLYLRIYDYDEFNCCRNLNGNAPRFIYA